MWHVCVCVQSHTTSKLKHISMLDNACSLAAWLACDGRLHLILSFVFFSSFSLLVILYGCFILLEHFGCGVSFDSAISDQKTITTYFLISSTHYFDRPSLVAIYITHKLQNAIAMLQSIIMCVLLLNPKAHTHTGLCTHLPANGNQL